VSIWLSYTFFFLHADSCESYSASKTSGHLRWDDECDRETRPEREEKTGNTLQPLRRGDFCRLLLRKRGTARHCVCIVETELFDPNEVTDAEQMLVPVPTMSLAEALQLFELSDDAKIMLAYTIARSTWQYYGTEVMRSRWTSGVIHSLNLYNIEEQF
jgi:hypothetical protein